MNFIDKILEKVMGKPKKAQVPLLEESTIKEEKRIKVTYFSQVRDGNLVHDIRIIDENGKRNKLGEFSVNKDREKQTTDISIRNLVDDLQSIITPLNDATNMYGLNLSREKAKNVLQEITEKHPTFVLDNEIINFIDTYKPEEVMDVTEVEKLPKKIDINKLTPSERREYAIQKEILMKKLNEIHTANDAWENREEILSVIQGIENTPSNPIIDAIKKGEEEGIELDIETLKLISKSMEGIPNEDGALYSVYLRIEENRIWKKIKLTISKYADNVDKDALDNFAKALGQLNKYELHDIEKGFSSEILDHIINEINNMDTERYINEINDIDLLLADVLRSDFPEMEGKDKMLEFFDSRVASLGQLSNTKEGNPLREFIETTDFKDEDNTESKEFLLLAAQVAKKYLEDQFKDFEEISIEKGVNAFKERIASSAITNDEVKPTYGYKTNIRESEQDMTK